MKSYQIKSEARLNPRFETEFYPMLSQRPGFDALDAKVDELLADNNAYYAQVDVENVVDRLNRIEDEIRKYLVNRYEITHQGIRALLTAEHQFLFSSAGVAKSLYAKQMFSYIKECDLFSIQFSPDTTPDDLFGAYDIEKFKKGEIYHNVEGSIITNNFAFLDEFMDGNDKLLRSLLGVLLERRFIAGNQVEQALLHTAIATSNSMRISETTEALLDRFLYKAYIMPKKDPFTLLKIDHVYNDHAGEVQTPHADHQINMRELHYVKNIVRGWSPGKRIHVPIEVRYLKNFIVSSFEEEMRKYREGYYISPRTISKGNDLLRANALLKKRWVVDESDVDELSYLFCTLNEPLTDDHSLVSQDLFHQLAQKRRQYFSRFKDEITPLLYLFEFLCEAEHNPSILDQPLEFLEPLTQHSLMNDVFDRLKGIFLKEGQQRQANRKNIETYLSTIQSNYREVTEFKQRIEEFSRSLF